MSFMKRKLRIAFTLLLVTTGLMLWGIFARADENTTMNHHNLHPRTPYASRKYKNTTANHHDLRPRAMNVSALTDTPSERVLLYFTTYPSPQHLQFMQECWPQLIQQSTLLSTADVLVYLGGIVTPAFLQQWQAVLQKLPVNATLRYDELNPGYQQGAMRGMHEMLANGWWKGYDWVIRLNPDVLIYNDSYLRVLMFPLDVRVSAVLANCLPNPASLVVHTDFMVLRSSALPLDAFADWKTFPNAERQATRAFAGVIGNNATAWIQLHNPWDSDCRIRGNGIWHAHGSCAVALREKPWLGTDRACPRPSWKTLSFSAVHASGYMC